MRMRHNKIYKVSKALSRIKTISKVSDLHQQRTIFKIPKASKLYNSLMAHLRILKIKMPIFKGRLSIKILIDSNQVYWEIHSLRLLKSQLKFLKLKRIHVKARYLWMMKMIKSYRWITRCKLKSIKDWKMIFKIKSKSSLT